jgi:hypothetical protein
MCKLRRRERKEKERERYGKAVEEAKVDPRGEKNNEAHKEGEAKDEAIRETVEIIFLIKRINLLKRHKRG